MFEGLKARLAAQITSATQDVSRAEAARAKADAFLLAVRAQVSAAQASLEQATVALGQAQAALASAQAAQAARQRAVADADQAVREWQSELPDTQLPSGRPDAERREWLARGAVLKRAAAAARTALATATTAVAQAAAARDRSAAAVDAARNGLASAQAAVAAAESSVTAAASAVKQKQEALRALRLRHEELGATELRVLAEPLDRGELELVADAQLGEIQRLRHERRAARDTRYSLHQQRAAILAAGDAASDDLAVIAMAARSWGDAAHFSGLVEVAALIDPIAAASREQRARPTRQRTDDLAGQASAAATVLARLSSVGALATDERDAASGTLAAAAAALAALNAEAP